MPNATALLAKLYPNIPFKNFKKKKKTSAKIYPSYSNGQESEEHCKKIPFAKKSYITFIGRVLHNVKAGHGLINQISGQI